MKKFLFSILAVVYLWATMGATLHLHYCMGRLADTGFVKEDKGNCSLCGMEKTGGDNKGCCHDQEETVKLSIDQKYSTVSLFHFEQPFSEPEAVFTGFQPQLISNAGDKVSPVSNAPPRSPQVPHYLMFCHLSI